ncbi:alpha-glucosidase [Vibrio mytili]|uniref:glycoside hydrolase family 13 protein n=1 Tax=Vibrio mytili TaxID=50718 RepID=UPI003C6F87E2
MNTINPGTIVYQIYPKSFADSNNDGIGDLQGVISKLDYLTDLGVNAIWLSPVYKSPLDDNGYDISDYQSILPQFGTMSDLDQLIEECHSRDIKIIMDLVINHCSDEHEWFEQSKLSKDNPYSDYFHWADGVNGKEPNKWRSAFGGSAWEYEPQRDQYYLHVFSKKQPDLNWSNPKLVEEIHTMIAWWLEKGVDGFRIDAISFLEKPNDFHACESDDFATVPCANKDIGHGYIKGFMDVINRYNAFSVGEINDIDSKGIMTYVSPEAQQFQMAISFVPPEIEVFNNDLVAYYKSQLQTKLEIEQQGAWNTLFFSNHDKPRQVSLFGNDAKEYWKDSAKALAVLTLTQKGTPFLYQGEEIGMTNCYYDSIAQYNDLDTINKYNEKVLAGMDPAQALMEVSLASRDNARTPMQWTHGDFAGFSQVKPWLDVNPNKDTINVESQINESTSILNHYKNLINLRKKEKTLTLGDTKLIDLDKNIVAYERKFENERFVVAVNMSTDSVSIKESTLQSMTPLMSNNYHNNKLESYGYVIYKG